MTNQTSETKLERAKHDLRIKVLLDKLRSKLNNFSVLDNRGLIVGKVNNVYLDRARQLNLVISNSDVPGSPQFLLRTNHIQQVDYPTKYLSINISKAEIKQLPEYQASQNLQMRSSQVSAATVEEQKTQTNDTSSYAEQMSVPSDSGDYVESTEDDSSEDYDESYVVAEEVIGLLEERLIVNLNKRKLGEVVVRKEVETRMVEVPVQYEKLIVEQVSPERKQLAEIDLGQGEIPAIGEITEASSQAAIREVTETRNRVTQSTVTGEFTSPKTVSLLLDAIARQKHHGCKRIRVEIELEDSEHQETYQDWFNRCSGT